MCNCNNEWTPIPIIGQKPIEERIDNIEQALAIVEAKCEALLSALQSDSLNPLATTMSVTKSLRKHRKDLV